MTQLNSWKTWVPYASSIGVCVIVSTSEDKTQYLWNRLVSVSYIARCCHLTITLHKYGCNFHSSSKTQKSSSAELEEQYLRCLYLNLKKKKTNKPNNKEKKIKGKLYSKINSHLAKLSTSPPNACSFQKNHSFNRLFSPHASVFLCRLHILILVEQPKRLMKQLSKNVSE